jgi:O-antigen ligase
MATVVGFNFSLGVPLIAAQLFDKSRKKRLLFLVFVLVLCVVGLILSYSRGAIVGTMVAMFLVLYLHKRQRLLVAGIVIGIMAIFLYSSALQLLPQTQQRFVQGEDGSAGGRLPYVKIGLRMFEDRPLTGWGFGGFSENCMRYGSPIKLEAHNTPVQVLVEYGILGLVAFVLMIGLSIRGYIGYIQTGGSPALRTLSIGFLAALVAITIDGLVHDLEWNLVFWLALIFGFLMQHYRRAERYVRYAGSASHASAMQIQDGRKFA